jgi:hypothetical protein
MSMETKRPPDPHGDPHGAGGPGYEKSDANIPSLVKGGLTLAVVLIVSFIGMRYTLDYFQKTQPLGPPASAVPTAPAPAQGPMLQVRPHQELVDYCNGQERKLNSYGWVDQTSGVVHIPVDRAIELSLERGFPTRAASAAPPGTSGVHQVGSVEAPLPEGIGGSCGYIYGRSQEEEKQREAAEEQEKMPKD